MMTPVLPETEEEQTQTSSNDNGNNWKREPRIKSQGKNAEKKRLNNKRKENIHE